MTKKYFAVEFFVHSEDEILNALMDIESYSHRSFEYSKRNNQKTRFAYFHTTNKAKLVKDIINALRGKSFRWSVNYQYVMLASDVKFYDWNK